MPIFDQGYQHWQGHLEGHAWRWLAITREGIRTQFRKKGLRWYTIASFTPVLALVAFLIMWGLLEQGSSLLQPFMFLFQSLPDEIRRGPAAYRQPIWTMAYNYFFVFQTFFSMILVAIVGPDLISQDLRFNAIPLYFSRPLRRIDYFLGKLGVIAFFLALTTVAPALVAYLAGMLFSFGFDMLKETMPLLLGILVYSLVVMLSAGTLVLAISSLSRSSRLVAAVWVGLWILGYFTAGTLQNVVRQPWCPLVSYTNNLARLREESLGTMAAREKILEAIIRTREAAQETAMRATPLGRIASSLRGKQEMTAERLAELRAEMRVPEPLRLYADQFPWTWSAGVLLALFVISVWILSTRVKTLDRLK